MVNHLSTVRSTRKILYGSGGLLGRSFPIVNLVDDLRSWDEVVVLTGCKPN